MTTRGALCWDKGLTANLKHQIFRPRLRILLLLVQESKLVDSSVKLWVTSKSDFGGPDR